MKTAGLHPPPKACQCGRPGTVTMLEVVHLPSSRVRRGAFSQFGQTIRKKLVLRPAYGFKRWIVECSDCYGNTGQKEMFG